MMVMALRLFTGIALSKDIISEFQNFTNKQPRQQGFRWIPSVNWHITTCFIGDTDEKELPVIHNNLKSVSQYIQPFTLTFSSFHFAPKRRPHMIWGRFEKSGAFSELTKTLHHKLGIRKNHKDAIPHVTLARFKGEPGFKIITEEWNVHDLPVNNLVLWKSELSPKGATYYELERFHLNV